MTDPPTCGKCLSTAKGEHDWIPNHLKKDPKFKFDCLCDCHTNSS